MECQHPVPIPRAVLRVVLKAFPGTVLRAGQLFSMQQLCRVGPQLIHCSTMQVLGEHLQYYTTFPARVNCVCSESSVGVAPAQKDNPADSSLPLYAPS